MEEKPKHRYEIIAELLGYDSIRLFESEIRVAESSIAQAIRRESKVSRNNADKIKTRFPQVNRDWLLTGKGAALLYSPTTGTVHEADTKYGETQKPRSLSTAILDLFGMMSKDTRSPDTIDMLKEVLLMSEQQGKELAEMKQILEEKKKKK